MGFVWVEEKENDEKFEKHMEEATKSLSKTNRDLLDEVKQLKKKIKEFDGISVDEYNKIKNELEVLKNKAGNNDSELATQVRVLSEQLKKVEEDSKKRIDVLDNENKKLLVDDEINKALIGVNVKSTMMKAARRIIKADVSVIEKDGTRKAVIGDKSIKDFITEWSTTDEGKNFIKAPNHSGGNSSGNNNNLVIEGDYDKYFDPNSKTFNRTKQAQLRKTNKEMYDNLVKKFKK